MLVGVQGAGLQWVKFMGNIAKSTLIEIAWPSSHWDFMYSGMYAGRLQTLQLAVESKDVSGKSGIDVIFILHMKSLSTCAMIYRGLMKWK